MEAQSAPLASSETKDTGMHIVFDLETSGLASANADYADISKYDSARIVSIAWIVLDKDLTEVKREYHVIKPNDFVIPDAAIAIHGITNEQALQHGEHINDVMYAFYSSTRGCKFLVSHNTRFDRNVLLSELCRQKLCKVLDKFRWLKTYCTMQNGRRLLRLPKVPRLGELYNTLYGQPMVDAHNAEADAHHCALCYKRLLQLPQTVQL